MKRILSFYIIREIAALFILGISIFTLVLVMGRLIKLTEMVVSRGVALIDVVHLLACLMPSFLIFTIPMAFLLAVLVAFGRLSADNEITVMKSAGISLVQLMPPVMACAAVATALTLAAGVYGIPWGNTSFKRLSIEILKKNVSLGLREKVFWDNIPGFVLYTDQYDEQKKVLKGIVIHDGRDQKRPMTIFAADGLIGAGPGAGDISIVLHNGAMHSAGAGNEYRLISFGEYSLALRDPGTGSGGISRNELDMGIGELNSSIRDPATSPATRIRMVSELHSRFAFPCAALVFGVLAVPLGIQNRRSGKSVGFATSIFVLLAYYILLSFLKTLADKGAIPPFIALWIPNAIFLALGSLLLRQASLERGIPLPDFNRIMGRFWRRGEP